MKQLERSSIVRIVSDLAKSGTMIEIQTINFLNELLRKYGVKHEDVKMADTLTMADAFNCLKKMHESLKQDILGDLRIAGFPNKACSMEEALYLFAVVVCLSKKLSSQSEIYSVELPDSLSSHQSQLLYIEGEYYKETNREILSHYREIVNELRLIGLNFVYIPKVREHYASLSPENLNTLFSFLYPAISDLQINRTIKQLSTLSTSDFCRSEIVSRMNMENLVHALPSVLIKVGMSYVGGKKYSNYLVIVIEDEALVFIRNMVNLFMSLYKPHLLNPICEEEGKFIYQGFHKQLLDSFVYKGGIRSSVVVDTVHGDILLPEAETKIIGLHRREKALYTLFLLESSTGGINFNKPVGTKSLERYNHRMAALQKKYEIIYENFGGQRAKAPQIEFPENRLPMLSLIKRQFRQLGDLLNQPDDYLVQRNHFGNYCVAIPPELCLCFDSMTKRVCTFEESDYWRKLLAI